MGLSSSKVKTTENRKTNETTSGTTMPVTPPWLSSGLQDYFGQIGSFAGQDPQSLVAGPSALQQQAWAGAGNLGGWQANLGHAGELARNVGGAGANTYSAPQIGPAGQATAQRGSEFMSSYLNPYTEQVVDASLADFNDQAGQQQARLAAQGARAGAFGGSRFGIAEGQLAADQARDAGLLSAGLRSQAFDRAAGFGMADADRFGNIGVFNTGQGNQFALAQGGFDQAAGQFNAGQEDNSLLRQLQAAGMLGDLSQAQGTGERADLGLLAQLGDQQRGVEQQQALGPLAQLEAVGGLYNQFPYQPLVGQSVNGTTSGTMSGTSVQKSSPSLFNQLLSGASLFSGLGGFGMFGGGK